MLPKSSLESKQKLDSLNPRLEIVHQKAKKHVYPTKAMKLHDEILKGHTNNIGLPKLVQTTPEESKQYTMFEAKKPENRTQKTDETNKINKLNKLYFKKTN